MATRGVFQCQKLTLRYCEYGGSSRAVRDYLSSGRLVDWATSRPSVEIKVKVQNGKHPIVTGDYVTKAVSNKSIGGNMTGKQSKPVIHQICLKSKGGHGQGNGNNASDNHDNLITVINFDKKVNKTNGANPIEDALNLLYNKSGRKMKKFTKPIYTDTPSIQGVWTPSLDLHLIPKDVIDNKLFKLTIN
jgi:hypothetical protein